MAYYRSKPQMESSAFERLLRMPPRAVKSVKKELDKFDDGKFSIRSSELCFSIFRLSGTESSKSRILIKHLRYFPRGLVFFVVGTCHNSKRESGTQSESTNEDVSFCVICFYRCFGPKIVRAARKKSQGSSATAHATNWLAPLHVRKNP